MKYATLIFALLAATTGWSQTTKGTKTTDSIYTTVEQMPKPSEDWLESFGKHFIYPDSATIEKEGIQGKIALEFVVYEDGHTDNYVVLHPKNTHFEQAAVTAFKQLPKWKPGRHNGKAVKVRYMMPITIDPQY